MTTETSIDATLDGLRQDFAAKDAALQQALAGNADRDTIIAALKERDAAAASRDVWQNKVIQDYYTLHNAMAGLGDLTLKDLKRQYTADEIKAAILKKLFGGGSTPTVPKPARKLLQVAPLDATKLPSSAQGWLGLTTKLYGGEYAKVSNLTPLTKPGSFNPTVASHLLYEESVGRQVVYGDIMARAITGATGSDTAYRNALYHLKIMKAAFEKYGNFRVKDPTWSIDNAKEKTLAWSAVACLCEDIVESGIATSEDMALVTWWVGKYQGVYEKRNLERLKTPDNVSDITHPFLAAIRTMNALYKVTGTERYKARRDELAAMTGPGKDFQLVTLPDGTELYVWGTFVLERSRQIKRDVTRDNWHMAFYAAFVMGQAYDLSKQGILFTERDLTRFANTVEHSLMMNPKSGWIDKTGKTGVADIYKDVGGAVVKRLDERKPQEKRTVGGLNYQDVGFAGGEYFMSKEQWLHYPAAVLMPYHSERAVRIYQDWYGPVDKPLNASSVLLPTPAGMLLRELAM